MTKRRSHDINGSKRVNPPTPPTTNLFKRGNYSLLRLLTIVNAAKYALMTHILKEYLTEHKNKV